MNSVNQDVLRLLQRIATGIEHLGPPPDAPVDVKSADHYRWNPAKKLLEPVLFPAALPFDLLYGIDTARERLLANTLQFARGYTANHALLFGPSGMGKSALIKAVHAEANRQASHSLVMVEIYPHDILSLADLLSVLRGWVVRRFIIFCDNLGNGHSDTLKTLLDGSSLPWPDHILFYATQGANALSFTERFGLNLEVPAASEEVYLAIIERYTSYYKPDGHMQQIKAEALSWAASRQDYSGRTAWQFLLDYAGRQKQKI